jgi:hypothetical protein
LRRLIIYTILLLFCKFLLAQTIVFSTRSLPPDNTKVCCNSLVPYIDSLTEALYKDTSRFSYRDLVYRATSGTDNEHSYLPLFIINDVYFYKLDIVNSSKVKEFVREYLSGSKVDTIIIWHKGDPYASIFGLHGRNGVVQIQLKKGAKFNPDVAGLKEYGKTFGNNYEQGGRDITYRHY